jgi:hypothetical protein
MGDRLTQSRQRFAGMRIRAALAMLILVAMLVTPGALALGSAPGSPVTAVVVNSAMAVNMVGLSGVGPRGTIVNVPERPNPRSPCVPPPWAPGPPPWKPGKPPWKPGPPWTGD